MDETSCPVRQFEIDGRGGVQTCVQLTLLSVTFELALPQDNQVRTGVKPSMIILLLLLACICGNRTAVAD